MMTEKDTHVRFQACLKCPNIAGYPRFQVKTTLSSMCCTKYGKCRIHKKEFDLKNAIADRQNVGRDVLTSQI